jgi:hypothetical protein
VNAVWTWLDTSPVAAWLFYGVLLTVAYLCRRRLERRTVPPRSTRKIPDGYEAKVVFDPCSGYARQILGICPSCGDPMQGQYCQNCADPMESVPLPSFAAHLRRIDEAVREANQRAHGIPSGVVLRCEVDTLLRWAGIGSDDRRLW